MDNITTLENFIIFCDDVQIAEEGLREGFGILDKIINALQRGLEWFKRAYYTFKEKTNKGKCIEVSDKCHEILTKALQKIDKSHNGNYETLTDEKLDDLKQSVENALKDAEVEKSSNKSTITIPISEFYQGLRAESDNISKDIKFAEQLKKQDDREKYTENIHRLSNEIDLMHLYTKIYNFYLNCSVNEK